MNQHTSLSSTVRGPRLLPAAGAAILLALVLATIALLGMTSREASAAAPPVTQCNNETASNVGGQGVRCTVTVVNYLTSAGALADAPASTVTMTRCTGAAGPIAAGAGTCATTTTTTAGEPITSVQQCNGEANGGGGVLICTVSITNYFQSTPASPIEPATIYQCTGSVISGPGAPANCSPANTPGVTSIGAATVGQCNGSGNGGESVGFTCIVTASTTTQTLPMHIDQCNLSSNGGTALTECRASVSNQVVPGATGTATVTTTTTPGATTTVSATATTTPGATTTVTATATTTPGATTTVTATATTTASATATATATGTAGTATPNPATTGTATPGTATPTATRTATPSTTSTPTNTATTPAAPAGTPVAATPAAPAPLPPNTGTGDAPSSTNVLPYAFAVLLALAATSFAIRRSSRQR